MGKQVLGTTFRMLFKMIFIALVLYLLYFFGTRAYDMVYDFVLGEPDPNAVVRDVEITIPQGANTQAIGEILEEEELIKNATLFTIRVKLLSEYDGKLRYGNFVLTTGMSEDEIIEILATEGERRQSVRFTIPEGYTVQQIAQVLENNEICTAEEFIDAVNNVEYEYEFLEDLPERLDGEPRLQGYLFPDTYEVSEGASAQTVVSNMLARFEQEFNDDYYTEIQRMGYTIDEIITIASLIEREARVAEERPTISGVIYNRLDTNMLLQIDATLHYIRTYYIDDQELSLANVTSHESRYNTYRHQGIPIGPIANPGGSSIRAAIYPEEHDYFYYVLRDPSTGEHAFNRTLEEHNRDVDRYLRN
ncbi:UPF0755 protein [Natranaerovirga hydrolytica]|uniref:Endolytic murein transglycosylase n=1 Tax=Natranaerovirga hydrolytica TaxID=680378 RepID=A0A4R1MYZ9_9FIRM|nr:endolytic transglycosylase MltG [Natranaerovirga hydrolytica]TCK98385.1 UPF0755 protein [Natranaerovirga hydrolytica]